MTEIAIRLLSHDEFALTYTDPLGRVMVFGVGEMVEPTVADISGGVGRGEHPNLGVADSHPSNKPVFRDDWFKTYDPANPPDGIPVEDDYGAEIGRYISPNPRIDIKKLMGW